MATREDAARLHKMWDSEELGRFQGSWIAFRDGEVISASRRLAELLRIYEADFLERRGPIIALVDFEPSQ